MDPDSIFNRLVLGHPMKTHTLATAALISLGTLAATPAIGQDLDGVPPTKSIVQLFETDSSSDVRVKSGPSVAELRQARGLYRARQRMARLEYNLWMGHEPLRPSWNSVPMMSSRYTSRRIYVPVYVHTR
jgi:hypothetical protein